MSFIGAIGQFRKKMDQKKSMPYWANHGRKYLLVSCRERWKSLEQEWTEALRINVNMSRLNKILDRRDRRWRIHWSKCLEQQRQRTQSRLDEPWRCNDR